MLFRNQHIVQSDDVRRGGPEVHATGWQGTEGAGVSVSGRGGGSRRTLYLHLGIIALFALALTLPFVNQAFHIDDAIFWDLATSREGSPLPQSLSGYHLMGAEFDQWRDTHPPADSLYMSLIMGVTGSEAEAPLHAGFVIFPIIAGISMYFLALRFSRCRLAAALLLLATPAVMVLSHTLMADAPMMAAWLAATALYVFGVDRDDLRLLILSGATASLAILTGYQALALFLLLPAYPLLAGRIAWKHVLPLLIPAAVFGLYSLTSVIQFGELPRFSHTGGTSLEANHLLDRIEGMLLHAGGITIFPLAMIVIFAIRRKRYLLLPLNFGIAIALGVYQRDAAGLSTAATVIYIVLMTAGITLLVNVVSETFIQLANAVKRRSVDTGFLFLALWLLVLMGTIMIALPHVTAKYTLVFVAPLIMLAFRELDKGLSSEKLVTVAIAVTLTLTLFLGTALSLADYRLAGSYRDFVASVDDSYPTDGTIWFVGEWGFRHYMEAEGYRYLTSADESPREGDLIISPSVADWPLAPSVAARTNHVEQVIAGSPWPLRLMSVEAEAGFYGTHWGLLPYSLDDVPVERFEVLRVGAGED